MDRGCRKRLGDASNSRMLQMGASLSLTRSGKTVLTKQIITHLLNDTTNKDQERLPLRIPLIDLNPQTQGAAYITPM
eukprot:5523774-Amphidinium_carterae.1